MSTTILLISTDRAPELRHSLPAALAQDDAEVVVLDNASSDETGELAREHGARHLRLETRLSWAEANNAVSPTPAAATTPSYASLNANGTGPYKIESHQPGVKTVFKLNENYWKKIEGNIKEIVFTPISSDATRVAALLSGEVDVIEPVPIQDIQRVKASGNADVLTGPDQRVILPDLAAGCSMADMAAIDQLETCWDELRMLGIGGVIPVTYINSTAAIKAFCGEHDGLVCTSSNAARVMAWAPYGLK